MRKVISSRNRLVYDLWVGLVAADLVPGDLGQLRDILTRHRAMAESLADAMVDVESKEDSDAKG